MSDTEPAEPAQGASGGTERAEPALGASGDTIALTGLRVRGRHGVFEHERRDGQEFVIDAVLYVDTRKAAASDELGDTIDYGMLAQELAAVVSGPPVRLIEVLADRLVAVCLQDERVGRATVTVHKPSAPIPLTFGDVAVTITRARSAATPAETQDE